MVCMCPVEPPSVDPERYLCCIVRLRATFAVRFGTEARLFFQVGLIRLFLCSSSPMWL